MRSVRVLFSAAVLAVSMVPLAEAQHVPLPPGGRIITFGDSLSDNGNLRAFGVAPPAPYAQGRFSNGPVWTELLAGGAMNSPVLGQPNAGSVNFAFGGARTDGALNPANPAATTPGMPTQLQLFAMTGGRFTAADTVTVLGGANNIFQYLESAGAGVTPAGLAGTSTAAATNIATLTSTIAGAGAGRILVSNLPNIAGAPDFNTNPAAAGAAAAATTIFNQALASGIAAAAAANPNTNIVQMDLASAFAIIQANPAAFGLVNVTQACVRVATCVTGSAATQNSFLFWDGVHPTAAGHRLIALYAGLLLNPEASAADSAVLGSTALRGRVAAADDISDRAIGWSQGQYERRNGTWISVTGSRAMLDARGDTPSHTYTVGGVRAGLDKAFSPNMLVGISIGANAGELGGVTRADLLSLDVDAYGTWTSGAFFITGGVGASWMSFDDMRRNTGFPTVDALASTSATTLSASIEAGMFAKVGAFTLAPSARLQVVHGSVDGYSETSPVLAMAFGGRSFDAVIGGVKIRASTPVGAGRAFGEVGFEHMLSHSQDGVLASFVGNTAKPFTGIPGEMVGRGLNLKLGYDAKLNDQASLTVSYGAALGDGTTHTGQVRVKMPF